MLLKQQKIIVPSKALGKFKNRNASITALRQHLRSHIRDPNETFDIHSAKRKLGLFWARVEKALAKGSPMSSRL